MTGNVVAFIPPGILAYALMAAWWFCFTHTAVRPHFVAGFAIFLALVAGATWPVTLLASILVAGTMVVFKRRDE